MFPCGCVGVEDRSLVTEALLKVVCDCLFIICHTLIQHSTAQNNFIFIHLVQPKHGCMENRCYFWEICRAQAVTLYFRNQCRLQSSPIRLIMDPDNIYRYEMYSIPSTCSKGNNCSCRVDEKKCLNNAYVGNNWCRVYKLSCAHRGVITASCTQ